MITRCFRMLCLILVMPLVGCGGGDDPNAYEGPKRATVKGKVTFDGAPVTDGIIAFLGIGGDKLHKTGGPIVNGEYSIAEAKGPNQGVYRVEIRWPKATGKKSKDPDSGEEIDVKSDVIPTKYNEASELTKEVVLGSNTFDFELSSK